MLKIKAEGLSVKCARNEDEAFDVLMDIGIDEQECIEASSWCGLACIGERYDSEHFTITVIED